MVETNDSANTVTVGGVTSEYDRVFGPEATQDDVYAFIKPTVSAVATVRSAPPTT